MAEWLDTMSSVTLGGFRLKFEASIYIYMQIGIMVRGFAKMVLDASLLNTQHYKVRIKDKWSNLSIEVAPFPST